MRQRQRYFLALAAMLLTVCVSTACSKPEPGDNGMEIPVPPTNEEHKEENGMNRNITITIGNTSFATTLAENESARVFATMLPLTIQMSELNGNEKYHYLNNSLPVDSHQPGTIHNGDLMLYGSNCVVLFYKTFTTGYSYTPLGQISNPAGLADALGNGDISVKFYIRQ